MDALWLGLALLQWLVLVLVVRAIVVPRKGAPTK